MRILLCDDNPLHLQHTEALLKPAIGNAELLTYTDARALQAAVEAGEALPDVAVLDIEMEGQDGVHIAALLNRVAPDCQIIFLSGHADFASEVYTTRHVWFVLKDRADEYLLPALQKAIDNLAAKTQSSLVFRAEGSTVALPPRNVLYIERVGRRSRVVTDTREYLSPSPPSALAGSASGAFVRCHQGFWVQMAHVQALDHGEFVMDNGDRIPISRTCRDAARSAFFDLHRL